MWTAFATLVPPFKVSLGSTYSQSVPFPLETGSSVRAAFTPTEKEFSLNLYLDAENCFLHVVARGGTLKVDQMINNVWQQLLTVGPYPGNIGQMQELKVKIHDNYVQVFHDNVFQIQLNTMLPSAKIRTLTFVNDNDSVVIEIHTMELERL
ncbi:uncharacterized protein LOC128219156 [Mya arenaria]|uniref:uncharacterized protein LOC128219156 n=1 Tax=Mya arenaria TaxID=6604 RepID=UPI0022E472C6|nr:uncharacterized protein LOC128219156 [Mya arenaria]